MPTPALPVDRYLSLLGDVAARFLGDARTAGLDAPVPTCPAWTTRALVAHQAMVHRFATAVVRGTDPAHEPKQTALRKRDDLLDLFEQGAAGLIDAIRSAPDELDVMTFLHEPPSPKTFWARRQAHETTMHGVDALGAALGRVPVVDECAIDDDLALDGIDEILGGFYPRGTSQLFDGREYDIVVAPHDTERRWIFHVARKNSVTRTTGDAADIEGALITGSAAEIYLGLWNRGELAVTGDDDLLDRWRDAHRITWN